MARLPLAIAGAAGRMGRALIAMIAASDDLCFAGGTGRAGSAALADPDLAHALGAALHVDVAAAASSACGWIDFTTPSATSAALAALAKTSVRFAVIGTTGLDAQAQQELTHAATRLAIVYASNFSLGINVLAGLVKQTAARLGPDWDIEILEAHHRRKIDAPSGTALMLGQAAAEGRNVALATARVSAREGLVGPRPEGSIGFAVLRGGGIVGAHEVMFAAEDEIIRLSHEAMDRSIFAKGALAAARWAADKEPGLYSMADVLGF